MPIDLLCGHVLAGENIEKLKQRRNLNRPSTIVVQVIGRTNPNNEKELLAIVYTFRKPFDEWNTGNCSSHAYSQMDS